MWLAWGCRVHHVKLCTQQETWLRGKPPFFNSCSRSKRFPTPNTLQYPTCNTAFFVISVIRQKDTKKGKEQPVFSSRAQDFWLSFEGEMERVVFASKHSRILEILERGSKMIHPKQTSEQENHKGMKILCDEQELHRFPTQDKNFAMVTSSTKLIENWEENIQKHENNHIQSVHRSQIIIIY